MPEYLAPGVFVEEVSYRSKSIEGVPTSTTGFAGLTRYGPVCYPGGPLSNEPRLVTSYAEFERMYGALDPLDVGTPESLTWRTPHGPTSSTAAGGSTSPGCTAQRARTSCWPSPGSW